MLKLYKLLLTQLLHWSAVDLNQPHLRTMFKALRKHNVHLLSSSAISHGPPFEGLLKKISHCGPVIDLSL